MMMMMMTMPFQHSSAALWCTKYPKYPGFRTSRINTELFRFSDFTQKLSGIGFALMTETLPLLRLASKSTKHLNVTQKKSSWTVRIICPAGKHDICGLFCLPSLGWYSCCWRCCPGPLNQSGLVAHQSGWDSGAAKWWPGPQLMKQHMTLMLDKTTPFFCLQLLVFKIIIYIYIIVENWGFSELNNWKKNTSSSHFVMIIMVSAVCRRQGMTIRTFLFTTIAVINIRHHRPTR